MTDAPANTPPPRISRPRPGLRKAAKWGGLILSILLVAAWVASAWWCVEIFASRWWTLWMDGGTAGLEWVTGEETSLQQGYVGHYSHEPRLNWRFQCGYGI